MTSGAQGNEVRWAAIRDYSNAGKSLMANIAPLSENITVLVYFGDVVFAVSGALTAARYRMDVIGFILIGTITGIGGGTVRDLIIGRTVWWTQNPFELLLCVSVSLLTYFFYQRVARHASMVWADALGLSAAAVAGCHIALGFGVAPEVAVFMGMLTGTGGGLIRDIITNTKPMITGGQLYASAALMGSGCYVLLHLVQVPEVVAQIAAFATAFGLRAAGIIFDVRMGPPGEFITIGDNSEPTSPSENEEQ